MNATEYQEYETSVDRFLCNVQMKAGCFSTKEDDEGYFSWSACDCCKRPLSGTRYDITFATVFNTQDESTICSDCVYYLTYGRLDDSTMLEIAA